MNRRRMMGLLPAIAVLPGSAENHPGLLKEPPSAPVTRWNLAMVGVFRPESAPPPPAPTSEIFQNALREVRSIGGENSATRSKKQSLLPNPPHPEYVSAHRTFSAAAAGVLESYFDKVSFSVGSDSVSGVKRSFKTFQECAAEIGQSRLYGGIHYRFSNLQGLALGKKVAIEVLRKTERRK